MSRAGAHAERRTAHPGLVVVVLAAGEGRRLRPLTDLRPKPLCPVGERALLDHALDGAGSVGAPVAVNLHHGADAVRDHLGALGRDDVHLSEERPEALGTAGAIGALREWADGRDVLVLNADTWAPGDLSGFVAAWEGDRPAVLVHGSDRFGPRVGVVASLLPWVDARRLAPVPSGLYEAVWRQAAAAGRLQAVAHDGPFVDCGTPVDYLEANRAAAASAGGRMVAEGAEVGAGSVAGLSVVGAGAAVEGRVVDSVVWPGCRVEAGEVLVRSVRASAAITVGPLPSASERPG